MENEEKKESYTVGELTDYEIVGGMRDIRVYEREINSRFGGNVSFEVDQLGEDLFGVKTNFDSLEEE